MFVDIPKPWQLADNISMTWWIKVTSLPLMKPGVSVRILETKKNWHEQEREKRGEVKEE